MNIEKTYNELFEQLILFGLNYISNEEDVKDAVQSVFLKLLYKKDKFPDAAKIRSYLFRAVKNKILDDLKGSKVRSKHSERLLEHVTLEENLSYEDLIIKSEIELHLAEALNSLPPQCKKVMELSLENLSNKEIAEDMQVSCTTVKTHKKIAKAKIKDIIGNIGYLFSIYF